MRSNQTVVIHVTRILEGGVCPHGHRVGDIFYFRGTPAEGMCPIAAGALTGLIATTAEAGCCPDGASEAALEVCCPAPAHPVVFALHRLEIGDPDWLRANFPLHVVFSQRVSRHAPESTPQWRGGKIHWHCPSFRPPGPARLKSCPTAKWR